METIENQSKSLSLRCLMVFPDNYQPNRDYPLVVLLHGFGSHMGDLATLAPAIEREGYIYVCPNAPTSLQIGPGMVGYSWAALGRQDTPESMGSTVALLNEFIDQIIKQYHVPSGKVILGGFSQGGGMAYRCALGKPKVFAGIAALSSTMPQPDEIGPLLPGPRTQAIFISHGANDSMIPLERAKETRGFLEAEGYTPFYKEYPMGHQITQEVLEDLVPWMRRVSPPLSLATPSNPEGQNV